VELLRIVQRRLEALDLGITRIAFVHHEASTDLLSTYCETGADGGPTGRDGEPRSSGPHFEPRALATVPSLGRLRDGRQARVLHDLERERDPTSDHSRWLLAQGWRASLTLPLFHHNRLLGFLFLDSTRAGAFDPRALAALEPHLELLLLRISHHFSELASLDGTLGQLLEIAELRDQETATHMERVSRYSRLSPCNWKRNVHSPPISARTSTVSPPSMTWARWAFRIGSCSSPSRSPKRKGW